MKCWKIYGLGALAALLSFSSAEAQVPPVPGGAAGAASLAGGPLAGAAPVAPAANIWSKICLTPEQRAACREKFCKHPLGKLISNSMKPMGMATGGILFTECCPPDLVKPSELAKPADSAEGAAARIKLSEAEAKARREAVRYLGTVDCAYWPDEAPPALVNALRGDPNECVRWEAAMALGRGCCCTELTVKYLANTVSGEKDDKGPAERSERVIFAAIIALEGCVLEAKCVEEPVVEEKKVVAPPDKEGPVKEGEKNDAKSKDAKKDEAGATSRKHINRPPTAKTVAYAKQVLAKARATRGGNLASAPNHAVMAARPSSEGIFGMVSYAMSDPKSRPVAQSPSPQVLATTSPTPPAPTAPVVPVSSVTKPESTPNVHVQPIPVTVPSEKRGLLYRLWSTPTQNVVPAPSPTSTTTPTPVPVRTATPVSRAPLPTTRRSGPVIGFVTLESNRVSPLDDLEP